MTWRRRMRPLGEALGKALTAVVVIVLVLVALGIGVVQTAWAQNSLRDLIVRQANTYLTATLSIDSLRGSLLRGIQLGNVDLSRSGQTLVHIDAVVLSYSIRELFQSGVIIRRVQLTRPRVVGSRLPDGGWDLAALVKREQRDENRTGPGRPIAIQSIEVIDGRVSLRDPLDFGDAHMPTDFESVNAAFTFTYEPVQWTLTFDRLSLMGHAPELAVNALAGRFGRGPGGWFFERLAVQTGRSTFTVDGRANNATAPTMLDLHVRAPRFSFQEWGGVLHGLKNIAVDGSFDTSLKGPLTALQTDLELLGTGGSVKGRLTLDTSVPGWHGAGAVDVERVNLARWLNRPDRPSEITGHLTFDLALELGRRFPRGVYTFSGPHAMYMNYAADGVNARGQITATRVVVSSAQATAYGARVATSDGSIGLDEPFPFHFQGTTQGIDLRRLPAAIPVPKVESLLTFAFDVSGRFANPAIAGNATFERSEYLGAHVSAGTVGTIDTLQFPIRFSGDGEIDAVNLRRFGEGLDVAWLRDPRFAGTASGHFHAQGSGADRNTLVLSGGGHLTRAEVFKGALTNADVSIDIAGGTLRGSYDGSFERIDPAVPFADARLDAALTGSGRFSATVRDLLTRSTTTIADVDVSGAATLRSSVVRGVEVDAGRIEATIASRC